MNATDTNAGGWEKSELRAKMNSGEIWSLMPPDFQSKVKTVRKLTNNVGGIDKNAAVTATSDRLFLLSYSEIAPCTSHWTSDFTSLWASVISNLLRINSSKPVQVIIVWVSHILFNK